MKRLGLGIVLAFGLTAFSAAQEHAPAGEKGAAHEEHKEKDMTGLKWANFAILAAGLGYLIVKQVGPYFATRSLEIRNGIEDARKISADAEKNAAAMEARLANLGVEVEALRKSSREEAAQEGERIRQETQRELAKIQAHADHDIASALKVAQAELKNHAAKIAVDLARVRVGERMSVSDQDDLVHGFIAGLARQSQSSDKGAR